MHSFFEHFNDKTDALMERLRALADGKTSICFLDEFNHLTFDVICKVCLLISLTKNIYIVHDPDPSHRDPQKCVLED